MKRKKGECLWNTSVSDNVLDDGWEGDDRRMDEREWPQNYQYSQPLAQTSKSSNIHMAKLAKGLKISKTNPNARIRLNSPDLLVNLSQKVHS
jgi:hypothetical protein